MPTKNPTYQIIFENESILIINKPTGVHSSIGQEATKTIVTFLQEFYPQNFEINKEGGMIQRLDFETSGCLLIAKTISAFQYFREQVNHHLITKEYLLLTDQILSTPLETKSFLYSRYRGSKKVSISEHPTARALYAETLFTLEKVLRKDLAYLVKARTNFGRRHQVRAQAASAHIPLIGDSLYGSNSNLATFGEGEFPKFVLHASTLIIPKNLFCPITSFHAPLPNYLAKFINSY